MSEMLLPEKQKKTVFRWDRTTLRKLKFFVLGREADKGLVFRLFIYVILIDVAYIYLKPLIIMVTTMIKDGSDLIDPSVIWVPRAIYLGTLEYAWNTLDYIRSFTFSLSLSLTIAVAQTFFCAVAGYAFARLTFPFKKFWLFCLLLGFIVPPQLTILPITLMMVQFNWMDTVLPLILPAVFGHGLKGALFVIIYRQFFIIQPKELEEAAVIDGASMFRLFWRVMLPLAKPAIVVIFLFSFVWNWNDFYYPNMFLLSNDVLPLSLGIHQISEQLAFEIIRRGPSIFDDSIKMSGAFLIILPPILLYMFTQRWFVEGVERTGLVE